MPSQGQNYLRRTPLNVTSIVYAPCPELSSVRMAVMILGLNQWSRAEVKTDSASSAGTISAGG